MQRVQKLERQLLVFTGTWEKVLLSSLWGLRWPHNDPHGGQPEGGVISEQIVTASPSQPGLEYQPVVCQIPSKTTKRWFCQ